MNKDIILSLILCSRNDSYMGNARWRLETTINQTLHHAKEAGFLNEIEILVSDWGSEKPLRNVLSLIDEAENRVYFLEIPPKVAAKEQKDSKFAEVIALNSVARRANGDFIGRIDNDTIIGKDFFIRFFSLIKNSTNLYFKLDDAFLFVERRSVPYRFSSKSYPLSNVELFLHLFGKILTIESARQYGKPFWWSPVGIMLFHKDIWHACRGYDEKLLYWGWMEGDIALRLRQKHHLIDFKDHVGNFFFHLEHYPNLTAYKDRNGPATPRKKNQVTTEKLEFAPNKKNWGLAEYELELVTYKSKIVENYKSPNSHSSRWLHFSVTVACLPFKLLLDNWKLYGQSLMSGKLSSLRISLGKSKAIIFKK